MSLRKIVDRAKLETKSKRIHNQAGYLVLPDCVIARSGILQYSDVVCEDGDTVADGALISVMRPASALKECYKQFANLPLTLEHPDNDAVTPENAKTLTVGCLGSNPKYVEKGGIGYIVCDIVVYDETAQQEIENGNFTELSAGYETAFRKKRGISPIGQPYEAEQFLLSPNHVALVERGRCGSECKVCDSKKEKPITTNTGDRKMAKKANSRFRYFLPVGDGDEVVELSPEQAEEIMEKEPDLEVEELDEEDVQLEDAHIAGVDLDEPEMEKDECEEADEGEDEICPECGDSPCTCHEGEGGTEAEVDEDEDEGTEEVEEETEEEDKVEEEADEGEDEITFEVAFEDGSVGKMDKVAYEHVQRFLEVNKKGDKVGDSLARVLTLTSKASKILGSKFNIETYTRGDSVDTDGIKRAIVRKMMPGVVVKGLRGSALDSLYDSAVRTHARKQDNFERDIDNLCSIEPSIAAKDSAAGDMVSNARSQFLNRIHKKNK